MLARACPQQLGLGGGARRGRHPRLVLVRAAYVHDRFLHHETGPAAPARLSWREIRGGLVVARLLIIYPSFGSRFEKF